MPLSRFPLHQRCFAANYPCVACRWHIHRPVLLKRVYCLWSWSRRHLFLGNLQGKIFHLWCYMTFPFTECNWTSALFNKPALYVTAGGQLLSLNVGSKKGLYGRGFRWNSAGAESYWPPIPSQYIWGTRKCNTVPTIMLLLILFF